MAKKSKTKKEEKEVSVKESVEKSEKEPEKINPRWDKINELYDAVDENIVTLGNKHEMNFVEIGMALHMINKKVEYEQFKAMFDFNIGEAQKEQMETKSPESMYR